MMKLLNSLNVQAQGMVQNVPCKPNVRKMELRGKHYVYDTNSMLLFEGTKEEVENISPGDLGGVTRPFVSPDLTNYPNKMIVYQATYACNLACRYCFVRAHYCTDQNRLSYDDAIRALDMFQTPQPGSGQGRKGYDIGFFGGEPLLNWELIYKVSQEVVARSKKLGIPANFHITTNATLMTEEIAEYCAKLGFTFIVSLDGPEAFHNQNRPYHKGTGSWEHVMRGLNFITNAYAKQGNPHRPTLRSTFDSDGVDLQQVMEFLNKLCYEGKGGHVSIEPSSLGEGCSTDPSRLEELDLAEIRAQFQEEYWKAADWFLAEIRSGRKPSFHHFEMMLQRMYDRVPSFSECGAGKGYVSVGPGGKISACHRENGAEIGNLENGIDPVRQAKWLDNRYFVRRSCNECWQRNVCGGGCRHDSIQYGQCICDPNPVECLFKDMYLEPVVWLMGEMTDKEKKMYSRQGQRQQRQPQQRQPQTQGSLKIVPETQSSTERPLLPHPATGCNDPRCECNLKKKAEEEKKKG